MTHMTASTPQEALVDYLRSLGCSNDEMVRLGTDAMSWHGAVYTAVERVRELSCVMLRRRGA